MHYCYNMEKYLQGIKWKKRNIKYTAWVQPKLNPITHPIYRKRLEGNTKTPLVVVFEKVETRRDFVAIFFHFSKSFNEHLLDSFLSDTNKQKINTYRPLVAT